MESVKAVGGFMPGKVVTEEKEKKVSVPDIRGMTEGKGKKSTHKEEHRISVSRSGRFRQI